MKNHMGDTGFQKSRRGIDNKQLSRRGGLAFRFWRGRVCLVVVATRLLQETYVFPWVALWGAHLLRLILNSKI